jgi:N-acetylglutamate synthase-like GNAT family acetyltransferase
MTATLRRAESRDIDAICNLLNTNMNPDFPVERWKGLFSHSWCRDDSDIGIVAEDGDRIVGYHGHICSSRTIGVRRERFVNFTSWYILKEYRGQGLGSAMIAMATADPDTTYTAFSLSPKRIDFFKALGMDVLEEERLLWRKTGEVYDNLELIHDPVQMVLRANPGEVRVLEDHLDLPVTPVLVSTKCTQCLLLLSISEKGDNVTYYDVLYRSNPRLFSERVGHIVEALLPEGNCVLAADRRFVEADEYEAEVETIKSPRFYKSARVKPCDVDLAYSELVLLDLKLD